MTPRTPAALAGWLDTVLPEPVVVVGSPPADARDLDLLCRPATADALAGALSGAGFVRHQGSWVRLVDCGAEVVDVLGTGSGVVPSAVVDRLFAAATPAEGCRYVLVPAAHHQLLLLARRTAGHRGSLSARRQARLDRLSVVTDAWERAQSEAADWQAQQALDQLRRRGRGDGPARIDRVRARRERTGTRGVAGVVAAAVPRRRATPIIAFCGLDGSGKSTQADALAHVLELVGYSVSRQWSRLTYDPTVERIAAPVKVALAAARRLRRSSAVSAATDADVTSAPRASGGALAAAWTLTLVGLHGLGHRRARRSAHGSVVVWDRYLVDALVQLRTDYAARGDTAAAERLLRRLSPRPLLTVFLDVPAEVAAARKDDFELPELVRHRQAYVDVLGVDVLGVDVLGAERVLVVDGTRPAAELCQEIAGAALRALAGAG